jgi:G3E family GTPase
MLGGFLGAGKTTTLLRLALHLQRAGKRVGLITNDQAEGQVDTALAEELELPVREITGGCFCCKSETLVEALSRLTADKQPEVFLAEPVGSCTDLIATVSLPLESIYQSGYVMAPYAVLVDPYRAEQTLGLAGDATVDFAELRSRRAANRGIFSPDVAYIYRKQLEEAEVIVINKVDVMAAERVARLRAALELEYPGTRVLTMASRAGDGMEELFRILTTEVAAHKPVMQLACQRATQRSVKFIRWLRRFLFGEADWDHMVAVLTQLLATP